MRSNQVVIPISDQIIQPAVLSLELPENRYRELAEWKGENELLYLEDESGSVSLLCQLSSLAFERAPGGMDVPNYTLLILLKDVPTDERKKLILTLNKKKVQEQRQGVYLDHQEHNARVVVNIDGKLFTRYLYSPDLMKPYYYPLIGPSGKTLIQDAPDDHLHHHGLWWGHDQVNGHQIYHEFAREGRQTHRSFMCLSSGPVMGQVTSQIDWLSRDGNCLLQEVRSMRIYALPESSRYIDVCSKLFAIKGDVVFGDTKEGGFPFIRVNEQINGHQTGIITASTGKQGETEVFGTVADWVDYSGQIKKNREHKVEAGISMFVHPDHKKFSSQWFVRDYGPFTSSNFHFCGGYTLASGDSICFKQRIYLHHSDVKTGRVKDRYTEYVQPIQPEWKI